MIKPGKHKLLIALMLACICAPVLSAEPNEAETGLKIEISSIKQGYSGVTKEDADAELRKSLKERPYLLNVVLHEGDLVLGTDLPKLTEQMIQEMGKMLDIINVEIVGIQAKLSAIEEYKSKPNVSAAVLVRLDEILCEQSIELAGTLARKKQATDSRARYQDVYNLHKQWETAVYRYEKVRGDVLGSPRRLSKLKKRLADPTPDMLPPKVYQNKVTIYPVRVEVD